MTPKETVTKYWRAWTDHNQADLLALLAPDFVSRNCLLLIPSQPQKVTNNLS
jgi:ketosteroid isomerase-like protein